MSLKPFYADDTTRLYLGDCRDVIPALDVRPDVVLADPPYDETAHHWDRWPVGWLDAVATITNSMWCFGTLRMFMVRAVEFGTARWHLSHDTIWHKHNASGPNADRFRRIHEQAGHFYRGRWADVYRSPQRITTGVIERGRVVTQGAKDIGHRGEYGAGAWVDDGTRLMTSVLQARSMHRRGGLHPCEKPVAGLLDPLIRYGCRPGGLVLDPFAGSGSTAEAARLSGRHAVLIEADERYAEVIARRLSADVLPIEVTA